DEGARLVAVNQNLSEEEAFRKFREVLDKMEGTLDLGGMTTDEYMEWLRGSREDLDVG
ncbi:AbrB/MazE/SpoVT family DNA-binding domain-containing protein, partial [Mesorhizobium sp. M2D.F.Ca.ET.160.01.1.1]